MEKKPVDKALLWFIEEQGEDELECRIFAMSESEAEEELKHYKLRNRLNSKERPNGRTDSYTELLPPQISSDLFANWAESSNDLIEKALLLGVASILRIIEDVPEKFKDSNYIAYILRRCVIAIKTSSGEGRRYTTTEHTLADFLSEVLTIIQGNRQQFHVDDSFIELSFELEFKVLQKTETVAAKLPSDNSLQKTLNGLKQRLDGFQSTTSAMMV
ncbi:MAG TPA: hypothetical protein DCE42_18770 [Myxococcales bacterium]|nr:hypothetical protein [Deltaproteobacteria bacterium]MBK07357.1 hypothetical protein [Deltaproteobacteria bacterium]MBU53518.1 hypothetical protein [Deltaproteobacteria bacterium]HAA56817.1 hypothetical protein [Myxococcales bacterium]|tara:strand:+ start:1032 stop:1679 length:648 start_codon:yes stop_codon:yes gene_type:complete